MCVFLLGCLLPCLISTVTAINLPKRNCMLHRILGTYISCVSPIFHAPPTTLQPSIKVQFDSEVTTISVASEGLLDHQLQMIRCIAPCNNNKARSALRVTPALTGGAAIAMEILHFPFVLWHMGRKCIHETRFRNAEGFVHCTMTRHWDRTTQRNETGKCTRGEVKPPAWVMPNAKCDQPAVNFNANSRPSSHGRAEGAMPRKGKRELWELRGTIF